MKVKCGDCEYFAYEDVDGRGICLIKKVHTRHDDECWLDYDIERKKKE